MSTSFKVSIALLYKDVGINFYTTSGKAAQDFNSMQNPRGGGLIQSLVIKRNRLSAKENFKEITKILHLVSIQGEIFEH
jgi:hypothetical protein